MLLFELQDVFGVFGLSGFGLVDAVTFSGLGLGDGL